MRKNANTQIGYYPMDKTATVHVTIIPKRIVKDIIKGIEMGFQITQTMDCNKTNQVK